MIDVTYNGGKIIDSIEATPPVTVTYNSSTIATLNAGDTKTLSCNGKVMASDVVIGSKTLQCNGKLMASDVVINVTQSRETWVINNLTKELFMEAWDITFASGFTSNGTHFSGLRYYYHWSRPLVYEYKLYYDDMRVYLFSVTGDWRGDAYRTITLDQPATGEFRTWLQDNAVKQS